MLGPELQLSVEQESQECFTHKTQGHRVNQKKPNSPPPPAPADKHHVTSDPGVGEAAECGLGESAECGRPLQGKLIAEGWLDTGKSLFMVNTK